MWSLYKGSHHSGVNVFTKWRSLADNHKACDKVLRLRGRGRRGFVKNWRSPYNGILCLYKSSYRSSVNVFTEWRYLAVQEKYCNLNFQAFICSFCKISWKVASKISYLELENQYYMPLSHKVSQKYKEQLNFQDLRDFRSLITLI